jgi:hypothetical protein
MLQPPFCLILMLTDRQIISFLADPVILGKVK